MRTTVEFDDDVAAAVENLRREERVGASEAVNVLIRRGLMPQEKRVRFTQLTRPLGMKIDVSNIADALDVLEGTTAR